jgi:hypothetical protein
MCACNIAHDSPTPCAAGEYRTKAAGVPRRMISRVA